MSKRILWLDNDPAYIRPYVNHLKEQDYDVTDVKTLTDAENKIYASQYDLFILDVMIPSKGQAEEELFKPEETDYGHKTGLLFYRRMKEKLDESRTPVLIMTVRLGKELLNDFVQAGLPRERFATKMSLRDVSVFLEKVESLLAESAP